MVHTIKCLLTDYVCVMARDKQNKYSGIYPNFECAGGRGARWLGSAAPVAAGGGVPYGTLFVIDGAKIVILIGLCNSLTEICKSVDSYS